jgi:DNA-binding transcriptional MerR regulator
MTEPKTRTASEVAARLDISPSTLRRWTVEFADFLSDGAIAAESQTRLYTAADLHLLDSVKSLLSEGCTYYQVGKRLEARQSSQDGEGERALAVSEGGGAAFAFISETLHTVSDSQQLLLGSQQATRDLLGVLLQDNFSLKEENSKLRDRMLNLERELTEFRRHNARQRRQLQIRLEHLEADTPEASGAAPRPPSAARHGADQTSSQDLPAEPKGCLAALLGVSE